MMSFLEAQRLAELERRVAALEARLAAGDGARQPEPLKRRNAARVADGQRLREEIERILAAHTGPAPLAAKGVLRALMQRGWTPLPSLRTVQWHLAAIRDAGHARTGNSMRWPETA